MSTSEKAWLNKTKIANSMNNVFTFSFIYVFAAAAANLIILFYGPSAVPAVSFVFVGFVIVVRDRLHDYWNGNKLALRMMSLVAAGSLATVLVQIEALTIALASAIAFFLSETLNAVVYSPMLKRKVSWMKRVNVGNVANASVDSFVFVYLAFGLLWEIILVQIIAKVLGGFMWSALLKKK